MAGMNTVNDAVCALLAAMSQFQNTKIQESGTASAGGTTSLTDAAKSWIADQWTNASVTITGGTGSGQTRLVSSNTATVLTVTVAWGTNPDATSTYTMTVPNVFNYDPLLLDGDSFPYAVVDVTASREARRGWGGTVGYGKKYVTHDVRVLIHDVSAVPITKESEFRDLLDAVRAKFRANQTIGETFGMLRFGEDIDVAFERSTGGGDMSVYDAIVTSQALEEIDG